MRKFWFSNRLSDANDLVSGSIAQAEPMQFASQHEALTFLRQVSGDSGALRDLRHWADRRGAGNVRTDDDLLQLAAACLVAKTLLVRAPIKKQRSGSAKDEEEVVARSDRRGSGPAQVRRAAPPPEEQADIDIDQQIAALKAAAQDGTPFCEQCERAKLEAAR